MKHFTKCDKNVKIKSDVWFKIVYNIHFNPAKNR